MNRRWFLLSLGLALAGCGGGSGGTDNTPAIPATQMRLFNNGAQWAYRGVRSPSTNIQQYSVTGIYYAKPGSNAAKLIGLPISAANDINISGALLRINHTQDNQSGMVTDVYGGTFRQDPATGDLFIIRLPDGELLDTPAKILPGTWSATTAIQSTFVSNGQFMGNYSLNVVGAENITTASFPPIKVPCWKTTIVAEGPLSGGVLNGLSGTFWYAPDYGNYIQAIPSSEFDIDRRFEGSIIEP